MKFLIKNFKIKGNILRKLLSLKYKRRNYPIAPMPIIFGKSLPHTMTGNFIEQNMLKDFD